MDEIKIAVLGLGRIGMRHIEIILRLKNFKLVATIDPVKPKLPDISHYRNLDDFLKAGEEVDLVVICTPNGLHASQATKCIRRGYHVIIEKPMALDSASANEVIETALVHDRKVFCVMQNRFSPVSQWLKDCIAKNRLGEIYMVDVQCYWNRDERYYITDGKQHSWHGKAELDGGPLYTQFSHFVDMVYWLFGNWTDIYASLGSFRNRKYTDFEDSGQVSFRLKDKILGSFSYTNATYSQNLLSAITIIAEKGSIRVGGQYMQELISYNIQDYEIPLDTLRAIERPPYNNHINIYENVHEVLKDGKKISTDAYEGMKVVSIIENIYKDKR